FRSASGTLYCFAPGLDRRLLTPENSGPRCWRAPSRRGPNLSQRCDRWPGLEPIYHRCGSVPTLSFARLVTARTGDSHLKQSRKMRFTPRAIVSRAMAKKTKSPRKTARPSRQVAWVVTKLGATPAKYIARVYAVDEAGAIKAA